MKRLLLSLLALSLLHAEPSTLSDQDKLSQALFEKAFKKSAKEKKFYLPFKINNILQDEIFVKIDSHNQIFITKETMIYIADLLKEKYKNQFKYRLDEKNFTPLASLNQFGITSEYNRKDILINIFIPVQLKKAQRLNFNRTRKKDLNGSILPKRYSGGTNLYLNQHYSNPSDSNTLENKPLNASADMFLNINDYVLEGRVQYRENANNKLSRGRVRVVKDDQKHHLRYTLGDIMLPSHNRMAYKDVLGIGIEKKFHINNDYTKNISKVNAYEFFIKNNSSVEIFVNERYRNTLNLVAGTYNLYDLNLPSGLNRVKLKIIEDGGKIEFLEFDDFSYAEILKKGVAKYGMGAGIPSTMDANSQWVYEANQQITSAYLEYGVSNNFTIENGIQVSNGYLSGDIELLIGSNFGLFNPYIIMSKTDNINGYKKGFDYKTNIGNTNINLGYEHMDKNYRTLSNYTNETVSNSTLYRGNIYTPIGFGINMGLSTSQYQQEDNLEKKYGLTLSKSFQKLTGRINLDRIDKKGDAVDDRIYITLDYRWGNSRYRYANHVNEQKQQINVGYTPQSRSGTSANFMYEDSETSHKCDASLIVYDEKFKLDSSYTLTDSESSTYKNQSLGLRLATGFVFAEDISTITAPISSSFIIIDNDEKITTHLGLEGYQADDAFVYHTFAIPTANYQEKKLVINEAELDFGVDLTNPKQKFISKYRSGLVMNIRVENQYSVKGIFYDKVTRKPLKYKAFKIFNTQTGKKESGFSNEIGEFTINQLEVGKYNVTFIKERAYEGVARFNFEIKEDENKNNLMDLGHVYIQMPKKKEIKKYLIYNKKTNKTLSQEVQNVLKNIYFEKNTYAITATEEEKLNKLAKVLIKYKELKIDIIGYADKIGSPAYNRELSYQRAKSVKSYLEQQNVKSSQLNTLGMGQEIKFKNQVTFQVR